MQIISRIFNRPRIRPKLGAFILALFLWLYVDLNQTTTDDINCKIAPVNVNPEKIIANRLPDNVTVNVTGKGIDLLWLNLFWKSEFRLALDLFGIEDYYDFPIRGETYIGMVQVPQSLQNEITINFIVAPDTIKVLLDELSVKRVPVGSKNIEITPKDGYCQVGPVFFDPDSVNITGPKMFVMNVSELLTEVKNFSNTDRDIEEEVELLLDNEFDFSSSISEVKLGADIQQKHESFPITVPIRMLRQPNSVEVQIIPSTISVTLSGGVDYLKEINPEDIVVTIDYNRNWQRSGEYEVIVNVLVPEYVINFKTSQNTIRVEIKDR